MATLTTLIARVKRALDLVGVGTRITDAVIVSQLNSSMLTIARRVKLPKLSASAWLYTNTTTFTAFTSGGGTTVEADLAIDFNPVAGADSKAVEIEITATGTFKHRINSGSWTEGVAITGLPQTIYKTISVTFANTTGYTAGDIWTFTAYADLPSNYHYGLIRVRRNADSGDLLVLRSFNELQTRYPDMDEVGTPCECAIGEQQQLFVQPCPSTSERVRAFYQRLPTDMPNTTPATETPDGLPESYQLTLLCDHSSWEIFEDVGESEQAARRLIKVDRGMMELMVEEGIADDIQETIRDEGMYAE